MTCLLTMYICQVLEALTTERCCERFSLERLEVLGDAFLKFAVGRHLFLKYEAFDEGQLTRKRSNAVNNSNLCKLAIKHNLLVNAGFLKYVLNKEISNIRSGREEVVGGLGGSV